MKKIITRLSVALLGMMIVLQNVVLAAVDAGQLRTKLEEMRDSIASVAQPVGAFLVFASVLFVGFNIIKNKDKADDRMKSMESLLWVGIGAFVIGAALLLGPAIAGSMGVK